MSYNLNRGSDGKHWKNSRKKRGTCNTTRNITEKKARKGGHFQYLLCKQYIADSPSSIAWPESALVLFPVFPVFVHLTVFEILGIQSLELWPCRAPSSLLGEGKQTEISRTEKASFPKVFLAFDGNWLHTNVLTHCCNTHCDIAIHF